MALKVGLLFPARGALFCFVGNTLNILKQICHKTFDARAVPYFVIRPENLVFDGNNPTLLDAYGGCVRA